MNPLNVVLAAACVLLIAGVCGPADASRSTKEQSATDARTPAATATPATSPLALAGLSGRLTYETASDDVTVQLPDATEIERHRTPAPSSEQVSADGEWRSTTKCVDDNCTATILTLIAASGAKRDVGVGGSIDDFQWSPDGHVAAIKAGGELRVIVDPAVDAPRAIASGAGGFAWRRDSRSIIVAENFNVGSYLDRVTLDGAQTSLAKLADVPPYLYPSPDRRRFAYTASSPAGWQLYVYDDDAGKVVFSGTMGSDGPGGTPVPIPAAEQKGPMFVAWSPDSSKLAFGGGYAPPYSMTLVDLESGRALKTDFHDGYPGEIKWTADGRSLAVSTYDPERKHHGAYVVDPATGLARYLISGCHVVWSPDGRFLALKGEQDRGVGIVDVVSGDHAQLTRDVVDVPIAWEH